MRRFDDTNDRDREIDPPVQAKAEPAVAQAPVPGAARSQEILARDHDGVKATMGAAFGTDFSGVSIAHDGLAEQKGAQAYAQGDSIHLAAGRGDPSTREGAALIGHELAHVQQQRAGRVAAPQGKGGAINADPALEREADVAGAAAVRGEPVPAQLHGDLGGGAGAGQAKAEGAPIQAFGSLEHQTYGNDGAKAAGYTGVFHQDTMAELGGVKDPPFRFELTHGDIVALSGDYFDPRDKDENGAPVADNLFKLAATPSPAPGQVPGTQDEIMYALKDAVPNDHRFQIGPKDEKIDPMFGNWANIKFSDAVKEAVGNRYLKLASTNFEHFAAPGGEKTRGPGAGNRGGAGGSYRALHEDALYRAHDAKKAGQPINEAMAHEAAAEHFLTDGFAAGHARTPRRSITEYWNAKYPLFFENFKKTIAQDVAIYVNANEWNRVTIFGSVLDIMNPIIAEIDKMTTTMPEVGMETIVGLLTHDVDNERGLWVTNQLGMQWQTFGDSHGGVKDPSAPEQKDTRKYVEQAVQLGIADVQNAYALDPAQSDGAVPAMVRQQTPAPAMAGHGNYGAEQMMPYPDSAKAAQNGVQEWMQPDFNALWHAPVRSDKPDDTFGIRILQSMASGDLGEQVKGLSAKFSAAYPTHGITLDLNAGYVHGFLEPMINPFTTKAKIQSIIDYDPGRGQANMRRDDATREDIDRLEEQGRVKGAHHETDPVTGQQADENTRLRGLTLAQRNEYIRNLSSFKGWTTSTNEQEKIVRLFDTAPPADRRPLYALVEGHPWGGHFKHGLTVWNDDLWNDLSGEKLRHLEKLLDDSP